MKKSLILAIALVFVVAACGDDDAIDTTSTTDTPSVPFVSGQPPAITDVSFSYLESLPVQVRATVQGDLPTPCHGLSSHVGPLADGQVTVVMTVTQPDADTMCAQVITPFEETLDLGSFAPGDYVMLLGGVEYPFTVQ